jgi:ribosomal protein S27AE
MKEGDDKNKEKIIKKIDGICPECGSSKMGVEIGEKIFDRTIVCGECGMILKCPKCGSKSIGHFESVWICGNCTHGFNRYPGAKNNNINEAI